MPTGQWFVDSVGTRWFFDSGSLALDFGYTGHYGYNNPAWEQLHRPADLTAWLTGRFGPLPSPVSQSAFASALQLRAAITSVARQLAARASPEPTDVDTINRVAAGADLPPVLAGGSDSEQPPTVPRALATIARDAVAVFSTEPGRIRHCGADNCALIFLDSSRPNSRRWCSMQRCGNRTKVRIHRSRGKENAS